MKTLLLILALPVAAFALAPGQPTPAQIRVYHREHGITNASYALGVDGKWVGEVPKVSACRPVAEAEGIYRAWLANRKPILNTVTNR